MISLVKSDEPEVLRNNAKNWTDELLRRLEAGDAPTEYLLSRYAHPGIKAALLVETFEKCAYCESPFRHVTYGDVEHISPKRMNPQLRFSWGNLTIACDVCNTKKAEHELVDPYQIDPSDAFFFIGPVIWARAGNDRAVVTEARLDLNRLPLVQRRLERLEFLRNLVASAHGKPADVRDAILDKARRECAPSPPFSACAKATLDLIAGMIT